MNFKQVSVADFRKNLQECINKDLKESPLLLARHSDVVAVILEPKLFNELLAKAAEWDLAHKILVNAGERKSEGEDVSS